MSKKKELKDRVAAIRKKNAEKILKEEFGIDTSDLQKKFDEFFTAFDARDIKRFEETRIQIEKILGIVDVIKGETNQTLEATKLEVAEMRKIIADMKTELDNTKNDIGLKIDEAKDAIVAGFPKTIKVEKPDWYQAFNENKFFEAAGGFVKDLSAIIKAWVAKTVFKIDLSDYTKKENPLAVRLVTSDKEDFYTARGGGGGGLGGIVQIDGNALNGVGNGAVASAGTRVALSVTPIECKFVIIVSHESNGELANPTLVIGDENVIAAAANRKGISLFPTMSQKFTINNLNKIYVDSVDNNAKFHFYYEN